MNRKHFQVFLFSNVSDQSYQNTLSSFTTSFNPPIKFDAEDEWHCAISQVYFNSMIHDDHEHINRSDVIVVDKFSSNKFINEHENIWNIEKLARYLMNMCENPEIYTRSYFNDYIRENTFFHLLSWSRHMHSEIVSPQGSNDERVFFTLDLSELLEDNQKIHDFLPTQLSNFENRLTLEIQKQKRVYTNPTQNFKKFIFSLNSLYGYTLKTILNTIIRNLFTKLRYTSHITSHPISEIYHNEFLGKFNTFKEFRNQHFKELRNSNILITKFINKFIDSIHIACVELKNSQKIYREPQFIFLYCDIISSNYCGGVENQLMAILPPVNTGGKRNFYFLNSLLYHKVAKKEISSISIVLCDQYGEHIKMHHSHLPTLVTLSFYNARNH